MRLSTIYLKMHRKTYAASYLLSAIRLVELQAELLFQMLSGAYSAKTDP